MRRHLVVGNQTLTSSELLGLLKARAIAEPTGFYILVPMRHPEGSWSWSEGGAHSAAEARLAEVLQHFREAGLDVAGGVGDTDPVAAVGDLLLTDPSFDEIVVSTLPPKLSRWLGQRVPQRIAREHPDLTVTHVVTEPAPAV